MGCRTRVGVTGVAPVGSLVVVVARARGVGRGAVEAASLLAPGIGSITCVAAVAMWAVGCWTRGVLPGGGWGGQGPGWQCHGSGCRRVADVAIRLGAGRAWGVLTRRGWVLPPLFLTRCWKSAGPGVCVLADALAENNTLTDLDLRWNYTGECSDFVEFALLDLKKFCFRNILQVRLPIQPIHHCPSIVLANLAPAPWPLERANRRHPSHSCGHPDP